ncbi:DNA-deoxyinosine glycosylase [Pseudobacteroides cellulosolvens]|uniref:Hypoxanthine-DNA glycosylase n=1 Tax=Pseudobacteroides cellulosolvens ATCC 35603 = DSM 2933 TaxID=398512 RepID=A0A0L6JM18_9FIRM|nr:DNA-deoxyinosine glycosylase [Pseudobacteroides cellulosolvens]KNY26846.1 Hypoxanthine-DNA glycosylase [Pseudobacteroides cellulosolvens ATCC 35603 = DSM 2933]
MKQLNMIYSFEPIINENCKILILGTMPGVQSLRKQEYYGNKQNAFWRIIYSLFDKELAIDYNEKKKFLLEHHIALWDVLEACDREGSLDSDIKNPKANDFVSLFNDYPRIKSIYFNGSPAETLFKRYVKAKFEKGDLKYRRLPSTSPAYTAAFLEKFDKWKIVLEDL